MLSVIFLAALLVLLSLHRYVDAHRRLGAWTDLGLIFNPHEGMNSSMRAFAAALRERYDADECCVVLRNGPWGERCAYRATRPGEDASRPDEARLADALLALPAQRALLCRPSRLRGGKPGYTAFDDGPAVDLRRAQAEPLAALAGASGAFVSVPLRSRHQPLGRIFLRSARRRYGGADLRALARLAAQAGPLVEIVQLAETLTTGGATQERRRISRDLHDGTVQPYVALRLGLEALRRMPAGAPLAHEIDELILVASDGISELRRYLGDLCEPAQQRAQAQSLVSGLREQVRRFGEFNGIEARLCADRDILVPARLHEELLYVVREALSNVRRHTRAKQVVVSLYSPPGALRIEVVNDRAGEDAPQFRPRSIAERLREIGGHVSVGARQGGETVVAAEIPF